jgi:hypothetical protein
MRATLLAVALAILAGPGPATAQSGVAEVSLRLGGKEVQIAPALRDRLAALAREILSRCGPNTVEHPHNFGVSVLSVGKRWRRALEGSRLHVAFGEPFESKSQLGGRLVVSEAVVGLEGEELFVGPDFTRHRGVIAEHLGCGYLASLELACLAELAPHLPARYRATCAKFERDAAGRIVMPPPDIAPSCS